MLPKDPPSASRLLYEEEERFVLSSRRAAIFIFFVGVIVLALLYLIRLDVDIKHGRIGERANIIEKTTPIFEDPVNTAINGVNNKEKMGNVYHPKRTATRELQRDPRSLLSSLFGSVYGRTDYPLAGTTSRLTSQ